MSSRRIIVTVPDAVADSHAARSEKAAWLPTAGLEGLPPSFKLDESFPPTRTRRRHATSGIARDSAAVSHGTILRGTLDEAHLAHAHEFRDPSGKPRVFSDPKLSLVGEVAFGQPPRGTADDVRTLLGQARLAKAGLTGNGVAIAIVDNGINIAFVRQKVAARFDAATSWSASPAVVPGESPVQHASMCAYDALLAAPDALLLDFAAVLNDNEGGSQISGILSEVMRAYARLLQLVELPAGQRQFHSLVVSNSWAISNPDWDFPEGAPGRFIDNPDHPFHTSVAELSSAGVDIIVAAGNCGRDAPEPSCAFAAGQATIVGASAYSEVITVAAVDVQGLIAGYSSHGPGAIDKAKPDLCGYTHFLGSEAFGPGQPDAGTSAACPVIAGVVAALRTTCPFDAADPSTSPAAIKQRLLSAAQRPALGSADVYGYGIVDTRSLTAPDPVSHPAPAPAPSPAKPTGPTRRPHRPPSTPPDRENLMDTPKDLTWKLLAEGSFEDMRSFFASASSGSPSPDDSTSPPITAGDSVGSSKLHRSKDGLIEVHLYKSRNDSTSLLQQVRNHWALLRDKGLADAQPVKIFADSEHPSSVIYAFKWKTAESRTKASMDPDVQKSAAALRATSSVRERLPAMNEIYQGFEAKTFPQRGGVELLRGKCTCRVKLDGVAEEFELDGQNGFVIMHRGPRLNQGSSRLMPVNILAHGADSPASAMGVAAMKDAAAARSTLMARNAGVSAKVLASGTAGPTIRVEQNTELPQFGIIRAKGPDTDFPATAMWVVHWRIHTPLGTLVTDPKVPLVFGPTTVQHYPPVGTEFKSSTGPVDIYLQGTDTVVGKLTPGELTAFDIVVTMDDEIPSSMDVPAAYYVDMFNKVVGDPAQQISTEGLTDDYRVPPDTISPK